MIEFRPFRNNDSPLLAEIWRTQASQRGLAQAVSAAMLEELVLNKSVFDRAGLILALADGRPLGFVHAGFGPSDDLGSLSTRLGLIGLLMLRQPEDSPTLAAELLARGEEYLESRGVRVLQAGGVCRRDPFYLGLCGGSEICGVLESDVRHRQLYLEQGYQDVAQSLVLHCDLSRFRPIVDRTQMQVRRRMLLQTIVDPPASSWWDAVTLGAFERTKFQLAARDGTPPAAEVAMWMMQPLSAGWGVHAAGLVDLHVNAVERRQGLATFLLGETLRQMAAQGISLVEAQVGADDRPVLALLTRLGFAQVDQAALLQKIAATPATTSTAASDHSSVSDESLLPAGANGRRAATFDSPE